MAENPISTSRRAVLGAAAAAAVAVAADALVRPQAVAAGSGTMVYGGTNDAGSSPTGLTSSAGAGSQTLKVENTGVGTGIYGKAGAVGQVAVYGLADSGFGVLGDTALLTKGSGLIGTWGRDRDTPGKIGAAGTSYAGTGVVGYVATGAGDALPPTPGMPTGVFGYAPSGTGVIARSETGVALRALGKVAFNRSGRAIVPMGKSYVDVDLTAKGGLSGAPLCFANILTRRPGVHVETVRPNDPSTGKLRIYLNKVPSTTSSTTIAWMVMS